MRALLWSNPGLCTWVPMGCELHHDRDLLWPRVVPSPAALGSVVTTESHTSACPESFKWRETKPELKAGLPKHHRSAHTAMPGPRPQETRTQGDICTMCDGTEGLAAEEQRTYRAGPESRSCGAPAPRSPTALAPVSCSGLGLSTRSSPFSKNKVSEGPEVPAPAGLRPTASKV